MGAITTSKTKKKKSDTQKNKLLYILLCGLSRLRCYWNDNVHVVKMWATWTSPLQSTDNRKNSDTNYLLRSFTNYGRVWALPRISHL